MCEYDEEEELALPVRSALALCWFPVVWAGWFSLSSPLGAEPDGGGAACCWAGAAGSFDSSMFTGEEAGPAERSAVAASGCWARLVASARFGADPPGGKPGEVGPVSRAEVVETASLDVDSLGVVQEQRGE